ncbi:MAG: M67 family metallopeptidase [Actinomycetales bacterium]|nr:M67 family metallopeptidase [Actinomycetales bacterium]
MGPIAQAEGPSVVSGLRIRASLLAEVIAHARADHPDEACGVIAGPAAQDSPERVIPMLNAARSPTFYEFESGELIRLHRALTAADERAVVIYHSHTATEAAPSPTDIAYAGDPAAHYLIVSTRDCHNGPGPVEVRSFRIVEGHVTEEPVHVLADPQPS